MLLSRVLVHTVVLHADTCRYACFDLHCYILPLLALKTQQLDSCHLFTPKVG